ncbi:MMPL family efflux pump permease component [Alphaproteobacteria bacterium]|nr:MMPL family efflux pump permease component [Alphaproteobacteria bacterium]
MRISPLLLAAYALAAVGAFAARPFALDTRLSDILPPPSGEAARRADALLDAYSGQVNVLVGARDFAQAVAAAAAFTALVPADPLPMPDLQSMARANWRLLSARAREDLLAGRTKAVRGRAQALLYSPLTPALLPLAADPFLLAPDYLMSLPVRASGFAPRQGWLAATVDGQTYIYLTARAPDLMAGDADRIEAAAAKVREAFPDVALSLSGVPVHGNRAMAASKVEMNVIAGVSAAMLIAMSFALFGSTGCFWLAAGTLGASIAVAFLWTAALFGRLHILSVVFGTSLIGLCVDYHLHYYIARAYTGKPLTVIRRALAVSFATSAAGFAVMALFPFPLLRQMAVLALIGLAGTYAIVRWLYPIILKNARIPKLPARMVEFERRLGPPAAKVAAALALIALAGLPFARTGAALTDLYRPDGQMLAREALFARVAGVKGAPKLLLPPSPEIEEAVRADLDAAGVAYRSATQFVPSPAVQEENWRLSGKLLSGEAAYLKTLGLDAADVRRRYEAQRQTAAELPEALKPLAGIIVVEEGDARETALRHGVPYYDRLAEITAALQSGLTAALLALAAMVGGIFLCLSACYRSLRTGARIVAPAALAVLATVGALGIAGVPLTMFHALALFLTVGFGADYAIFRHEAKDSGVPVLLAWATTWSAYTMLAFTGFAVTRAIGITLSIGLGLAYLLSPLAACPRRR